MQQQPGNLINLPLNRNDHVRQGSGVVYKMDAETNETNNSKADPEKKRKFRNLFERDR